MDLTETQMRIDARKQAEAAFALINEELDDKPDPWRDAFVACVQRLAKNMLLLRVPTTDLPMSDDEARRFEAAEMPFGKYKGEPIGEVPLDYLDWVISDPASFHRDLNRYLSRPETARLVDEKIVENEMRHRYQQGPARKRRR